MNIHDRFYKAYTFFNEHLFDNELGEVVITIRPRRNARGYFRPTQFKVREGDEGTYPEVNVNLSACAGRSDKEVLSTLVHELVHFQQQEQGRPSSSGKYHNKEWVGLMEAVGLIPYNTKDESKQTGNTISHRIKPGGPFDQWCDELLGDGWALDLIEVGGELTAQVAKRKKQLRRNKTKYTCPECGKNVWGKPEIEVACVPCTRSDRDGVLVVYEPEELN